MTNQMSNQTTTGHSEQMPPEPPITETHLTETLATELNDLLKDQSGWTE